jgi:acyl dehydratase
VASGHRSTAEAALVYTECSRIWNPIHTNPAVATRAGLPRPILHGTATLAMAVSNGAGDVISFDVRNARGEAAIDRGTVVLARR